MSYRENLKLEFERRLRRNPSYSLRAFSRHLKIDVAGLSRVMSGRMPLSRPAARRIVTLLDFDPQTADNFLRSVESEHKNKLASPINESSENKYVEVEPEVFKIISHWYHYAILELTFAEDFNPKPEVIARRLNIHPHIAKNAIERLLQLGLLEKINGTLKKTAVNLTIANKNTTGIGQKTLQRDVLSMGAKALDEIPLNERNMVSMTMAIDPDLLPIARKITQNFMRRLCNRLESGRRRRVYQLGICLYPIDHG